MELILCWCALLFIILLLIVAIALFHSRHKQQAKQHKLQKSVKDYIRSQVQGYLHLIENDSRVTDYLVENIFMHDRTYNMANTKEKLDNVILEYCLMVLQNEPILQAIKSNNPFLLQLLKQQPLYKSYNS